MYIIHYYKMYNEKFRGNEIAILILFFSQCPFRASVDATHHVDVKTCDVFTSFLFRHV